MEMSAAILMGSLIGGFIGVWILETLIDFLVMSRVMDDPLRGKVLATISAYFLASILYSFGAGSFAGFIYYIPGALLVGWLEVRSARKIQARIDSEDETSVFE